MQEVSGSSNETTPTTKRKPLVPPRPPGRQPNKPHLLYTLKQTGDQSECSIQRESVDGEYVCPNVLVDVTTFRGQRSREVIQLLNQDIAPPPHAAQRDNDGYLTLYMTSD